MPGNAAHTGPNQSPETGRLGMRPDVAKAMVKRLVLLPRAAQLAQGSEILALQEEARAEQQQLVQVAPFRAKMYDMPGNDFEERQAA